MYEDYTPTISEEERQARQRQRAEARRRRKLERLEQRLPKIADRSQCNHAWVLERTDGSTRYYYCEKCGAHHKQVVPQKADAAWE